MIIAIIYFVLGFVSSIMYHVINFAIENKQHDRSIHEYMEYDVEEELLITVLMFVMWPIIGFVALVAWLYIVVLKAALMKVKMYMWNRTEKKNGRN